MKIKLHELMKLKNMCVKGYPWPNWSTLDGTFAFFKKSMLFFMEPGCDLKSDSIPVPALYWLWYVSKSAVFPFLIIVISKFFQGCCKLFKKNKYHNVESVGFITALY